MQAVKVRDRPANPFRRGSVIWSVMEGGLQGEFDGLPGWADLTVTQIAEVLDVTAARVCDVLWKVRKKTGYVVPHSVSPSGWAARNTRRREAGE